MSTTIIRPDAFNSLSLLYHVDRKSSTVFLLFKSSLSNPFLFFFLSITFTNSALPVKLRVGF